METVEITVTRRQLNFLIDVMQDIASNRVRGDGARFAYELHEASQADELATLLLTQTMKPRA